MVYFKYLIYISFISAGLYFDKRIIYLFFLFLVIEEFLRSKKINSEYFLVISLYSIVLPDNYATELFFTLYFLLVLALNKRLKIKKNRYNLLLWILIVTGLISTVINCVPVVNIIFSIITLLPLFIFLLLMGNEREEKYVNLKRPIDKILFIEAVATIINLVINIEHITDDWSCGTFGKVGGQQAQLFVLMAYFIIYYLTYYNKNIYNKKMIGRLVIAGIILISTNSWTLLAMFLFGLTLSYIMTLNKKKIVFLISLMILLPLLVHPIYSALPNKITYVINRMLSDQEYFNYRFHKAKVYEDTFIEIPSKNVKFLLLGNGLGYYNSRGALICTGKYVGFYNKLFDASISEYTKKYILDYLELAYYHGGSDYGSVLARPYSSILALMGECGYLGCILFIWLIVEMLKGKKAGIKTLIITWLSFCLMENYFEYPKVILILYVCMLSMRKTYNIRQVKAL